MREVGFPGDDRALAEALAAGAPGAPAAVFDRYGPHVERVLANVLGLDEELPDLLHEVFARAFAEARSLEDPARLKAWLTRIAVFTARGRIRYRRRRRWLRFWAPHRLPDLPEGPAPLEAREALRATYEVLSRMPTEDRVVFALRFVSGLELAEVAAACGVSLATVKRRLGRAEARFVALAKDEPALAEPLREGGRWSEP